MADLALLALGIVAFSVAWIAGGETNIDVAKESLVAVTGPATRALLTDGSSPDFFFRQRSIKAW